MSSKEKPSYVILDRDGVINEDSPDYIKSVEEWVPIPGSLEAIAQLTRAGVDVFVATNQAGVARGRLSLASLLAIHTQMTKAVEALGGSIVDIRYCQHHPNDNCLCRKPRPGMLEDLAATHHLDLSQGYYVGDSLKDLEAAKAAGCTGVLVLSGKGLETKQVRPNHKPVFSNLLAFVQSLL